MLILNKHISATQPSINNIFYQFAVLNVSPIKQAKINEHHKMSFAPEMAAQSIIDNNKPLTFCAFFVLFIIWIIWLFFNKSVKRLIAQLY